MGSHGVKLKLLSFGQAIYIYWFNGEKSCVTLLGFCNMGPLVKDVISELFKLARLLNP